MAQNGLVPVTYERHNQRFWRRFTSYDFARCISTCVVLADEILQAAAAFPIAFRKSPGRVEPAALLTLEPHAPTPFVSETGQWLATYVPSSLRCPPFSARAADEGEFRLMVDETSDLVTDNPADNRFFAEDGVLSNELRDVCTFFRAYFAARQTTRNLCRVVDELGLLEPLPRHEGTDLPAGTMGVCAARLEALTQAQVAILAKSGALRMIHAQQVSLTHCAWLSGVQHQLTQKKWPETGSDLTGFLSALAHEHQRDNTLSLSAAGSAHALA